MPTSSPARSNLNSLACAAAPLTAAVLPLLAALLAFSAAPSAWAGPTTRTVRVGRTLEAVPGYPRVHAQLRKNGQAITGAPMKLSTLQSLQQLGDLSDLDKMLETAQGPAQSFRAFLDTGASAYVISKTTAERFDIRKAPNAVYHETGLHGETPMNVSAPYTLALAGSSGKLMGTPGKFHVVDRHARLQLNRKAPKNPLIELAMGAIDVIGMPAIRQHVVQINPAPMTGGAGAASAAQALKNIETLKDLQSSDFLENIGDVGAGPAVTLHPPGHEPVGVDLVIDLKYVDYARRQNPHDRGPLPTMTANPVVPRIETRHGNASFTGDWLLDTGAPASLISTEHARALGLYDKHGQPTRARDFALPLGGVGGQIKPVPGYRIDALRVPTADGRVIVYRDVSVLVTDITIKQDDGRTITLDGIFGTNLLLPTVAGMGSGLPTDMAPGPYAQVWIDGPDGRLLLKRRDTQDNTTNAPMRHRHE